MCFVLPFWIPSSILYTTPFVNPCPLFPCINSFFTQPHCPYNCPRHTLAFTIQLTLEYLVVRDQWSLSFPRSIAIYFPLQNPSPLVLEYSVFFISRHSRLPGAWGFSRYPECLPNPVLYTSIPCFLYSQISLSYIWDHINALFIVPNTYTHIYIYVYV